MTGEDTGRALALTTDGNHRWCAAGPRAGTTRVAAEALLNLACVAARPLAVVNCLNFGNPEHAEVMWELSEAIDGLAAACTAFGIPVIGGNVSLYNETRGRDIDPTPVIGLLGMIDRLEHRPCGAGLVPGGAVVLLGRGAPSLVGSRWAWERGATGGTLDPPDLEAVQAVASLVRELVADRVTAGVHDVGEGGLALALAEMAVSSSVGCRVGDVGDHVALFAESPDRVLACVRPDRLPEVDARARAAGVEVQVLGEAGGDRVVIGPLVDVALGDAVAAWRDRLPTAFGTAVTH
jgi:phosphoribosylformylglycinamidine synthase subunit PurL